LTKKLIFYQLTASLGDLMVLAEPELRQEIQKIQEEVNESSQVNDRNKKYIKMMSTTFRKRFDIGSLRFSVVEKIKHLADEKDLEISTKSGEEIYELNDNDWIVFTQNPVPIPPDEWFNELSARGYESEAEVSTYFIAPLLNKLEYDYEDIYMECPVKITMGASSDKSKRADFAVFNGPGRDKNDVLLTIESKIRDIAEKDIEEAKSYAKVLLPAYYLVTNAKQLIVFSFNGMKVDHSIAMKFDASMLKEKWKDLYRCISKEATISRKIDMQNKYS
jgi:hypothetical protein